MSGPLATVALILATGVITGLGGFGVGVAATWPWRAREAAHPTSAGGDGHGLSMADREQVAAEFAVHTAAVHQQVAEFADALAEGDVVLRERLRQFEAGGARS